MPLRLSVSQYFGTLRFAYTLHRGALKIAEKEEINSHKWVQGNEDGTHLKMLPTVGKVRRAWGF